MRRFRCTACGRQPAPGETVPLVGILVLRRRRVRERVGPVNQGDGWRWAEVPVMATRRYPARACLDCASRFRSRMKAAA